MVPYVIKSKIHQNLIRLLNTSYVNTTGYACLCWFQYPQSTMLFPSVINIELRTFDFLYDSFKQNNVLTPLLLLSYLSVSFWFVQKFLSTKICHEDGVKNIQRQVMEWRKSGMKQKMCTARPSWKSISLQNLTYKDSSYRV